MKIIDCFIFYNELDLLNYWLNMLDDIVDYFIIVESTHTFIGKEKELFFNNNKELFKKFENKIIHIIVNNLPHIHPNIDFSKGEQSNNERFQRNQIPIGFDNIKLDDEDIIIITDVDEIPNKNTLKTIKNGLIKINMNQLEMDLYYCNLNRRRFKTGHLKVSQIKFVGHDSKE